ncbi:MAG: hypothetical protein IJS32_09490, partial [Kiritimatiellae bacterium]|nr:hypothetical protein [Kiritimatiellia bacterium]
MNEGTRTKDAWRRFAAAVVLAVAAGSAFAAAGDSTDRAAPGFYVWQRDITPAVREAARAASAEGRGLFVLAGEFDRAADGSLHEPVPVP